MARFDPDKKPYKSQEKLMDDFCQILSDLNSPKQIKDFLKDLINRQERAMLIRRLQIAEMLLDGYSYSEICRKMKTGRSTIARVHRWLKCGRGGYKIAISLKKK